MSLFQILAILLTLSALFSYVNYRYLRLPMTIGLMVIALAMSLTLIGIGHFRPSVRDAAETMLRSIDFNKTLLHGMLGFLLFAGALNVDLDELRQHKLPILVLATVGVLISTVLIGTLVFWALRAVGIHMTFIHCLLFGALISPTDPIAVLAILKSLGAPKELEIQIAGESLFNDGVSVVVFMALLGLAGAGHAEADVDAASIAMLFLQEAAGGALFGLVIGWIAYLMLKSIDEYKVEILLSLALVTGGYALAELLHVSGPIAMVVAGLLIGNHGRAFAMSQSTREHLDTFWELVDEILNAVLFVLIGLEVLVLALGPEHLLAATLAIPVVLLARYVSVGLPFLWLRRLALTAPHAVKLMTWGGLRGGISVAMALSLRELLGEAALGTVETIVVMTYGVVVFAIIVQGLTIKRVIRSLLSARNR
jgi:CPA1 family monovalent cation:H+ antiporter